MQITRKILVPSLFVLAFVSLGVWQDQLNNESVAQGSRSVPKFEVDPFWPQPLPNKWVMGNSIGIDIDERDHIFIVHRDTDDVFHSQELLLDRGFATCCTAAPPVLEFDQSGRLINAWGGPSASGEYEWPASNHGLEVAPDGNVWIGGNGGGDSHVVVFTRDGQYVRTIGEPGNGVDSNADFHYSRVAEIAIDPGANEAYFADGYGNKRVAVIDVATGALKRYWGAYGNTPDDDADGAYVPGEPLPQQFRGPVHCAEPSNDGLIYVCDRGADRIQVFRPDGTYVKEAQVMPETLGSGSTWDIAFSPDADQEFIYLADGSNMQVHILDRESLAHLYSFGDGGRMAGLFFGTHSIATDSDGNIYTTETYEGKRVQKFVNQGMTSLSQIQEGAPWPSSSRL